MPLQSSTSCKGLDNFSATIRSVEAAATHVLEEDENVRDNMGSVGYWEDLLVAPRELDQGSTQHDEDAFELW